MNYSNKPICFRLLDDIVDVAWDEGERPELCLPQEVGEGDLHGTEGDSRSNSAAGQYQYIQVLSWKKKLLLSKL